VRIRCFLAAVSMLLPAAAFAQTITSSFQTTSPSGVVSVNIGKARCDPNQVIDFRVDYTPTGSAPTAGTDNVAFYITPDASTCTDSSKDPNAAAKQPQLGQFVINTTYLVSELITGLPNGCNDATKSAATPFTVFFCARRKTSSITQSQTLIANSLQVNFALLPPKAPSSPTTVEGDQHLRASWTSNDAGDRSYDVFVVQRAAGVTTAPPTIDVAAVAPVDTGIQQTSVDVTNASGGAPLQNGKTYDLYVRSVDAYANASVPSGPGTGTPFLVDDFYRHYRSEGGHDDGGGGCSSGETGFLAALAAIAVLLAKRRRLVAPFLLALLCAVPAARASDWTGQNRPPRFLFIAFKMDRYDPQIDSEAGLSGRPYHDIFHGRAPLRYQLEVDWEAAHPFGSVLLGVTGGFWQNYGHGLDTRTSPPSVSTDTTHLNIAPVGAVLTYRFDELADAVRWLPVIPYAQAGLMAALWSSYNGRGDVSTRPGGGRGSGWSYGYTTALGVALELDAIDAGLAREAFIDMGIQRTAAFAEYGWTHLDDFRKSGRLILSDRAWRFGFSVEF
jgi:MYXO-CTERM domain-containing protein